MRKGPDLTGQRYGKLLVLHREPKAHKNAFWRCRCDCGREVVHITANLRRSRQPARDCGCVGRASSARHNRRHGHTAGRKGHSPTYRSWAAMIQRCTNPTNRRHPEYGGRGITFCERWSVFDNFLADMGERPAGRSLDRLDPNGNYEPGNCRWATRIEQGATMRKTIRVEGTSLRDYCRQRDVDYETLYQRWKRGEDYGAVADELEARGKRFRPPRNRRDSPPA